jgi:hypothetical protein
VRLLSYIPLYPPIQNTLCFALETVSTDLSTVFLAADDHATRELEQLAQDAAGATVFPRTEMIGAPDMGF